MANTKSSECFHCHLPIPKNFTQTLEYKNKTCHFCCMGCFSICETIINNGLDDYYKFRTSVAPKADELVPEELKVFDEQEVLESFSSSQNHSEYSIELLCENLQCSACSWLIEKQIGSLTGINKISTNISEQTIFVTWDKENLALSTVLTELHELGYPAKPYNPEQLESLHLEKNKSWLKRLGLAGLGMMQVMMYAVALYIGAFDGIEKNHQSFLRWVSFLVATPVLFYSGLPFLTSAFRALKNKQLNMDVPISIALIMAYCTSVWATLIESGEVYFDSVTMFVFFLLIGRFLEYRTRQKVRQEFYQKDFNASLLVQKITIDKSTKTLPIQKVALGDLLLIKPGDTIIFDGVIKKGESSINEAMLSGEFMPANKKSGDPVLAGSINGDKSIEVEVTHLKEQGFLHKLKQMQKMALLDKPEITLIADKVARYFVAAILIIALATYLFWHFKDPNEALWITIAVLVVSCPCALSLATPVALTCGISSLNKRNILIQEQNFLQKLENTTDVIFDKTGTLTNGQLSIESIEAFADKTNDEILSIIAALEAESEHPIAKAFETFNDKKLLAENIVLHPYAGVEGDIKGESYWFGNIQFIKEQLSLEHQALDKNGLYLANQYGLTAKIILTDTLRESAKAACLDLMASGKRLHLLSGDPSQEVLKLANLLGIKNWKNNLKPEDKIAYIKTIKANSENVRVLTVGDGVNDAPAMALSDASMAMAGASDLTKAHAESYLLSANLKDITFALDKSKHTNTVIKQNITWAICYNLIMIPFAIVGLIPPYLAAIGMSLSSIVVVVNSLRLNPKS